MEEKRTEKKRKEKKRIWGFLCTGEMTIKRCKKQAQKEKESSTHERTEKELIVESLSLRDA